MLTPQMSLVHCSCCRHSDLSADNRLSTGDNRGAEDSVSIARSETGQVVDIRKEIKYGKPLRVSWPVFVLSYSWNGMCICCFFFSTAQAMWGLLADYSMNSTVHGVRYMFEQRRHWTER